MYEHHTAAVLPWPAFLRRMTRHGVWVIGAAIASIAVGMLGFHVLAEESWLDAYLNATMLLGGMGPLGEIRSSWGKIFAGLFALYAGLFFIGAFALLTAPVIHRLMHKFHAEERAARKRNSR
jgi:hypothetical protein